MTASLIKLEWLNFKRDIVATRECKALWGERAINVQFLGHYDSLRHPKVYASPKATRV